jgi:Na+/melibiose symporter-like transporter
MKNKKFKEAKKIIQYMAKVNGVQLDPSTWIFKDETSTEKKPLISHTLDESHNGQDNYIESSNKNMNVSQNDKIKEEKPLKILCENKVVLLNFIVVLVDWVALAFVFYLIQFSIKNLGGNFYINTIALAVAFCVGNIASIPFRRYLSTKVSLLISYGISLLFAIGLIIFQEGFMVSI